VEIENICDTTTCAASDNSELSAIVETCVETAESVWLMCVVSTCDDWWIETVESV